MLCRVEDVAVFTVGGKGECKLASKRKWGWGEGSGELLFNAGGVSVRVDDSSADDRVDGCATR